MVDDTAKVTPLRPRRPCPECGRPSARDAYPFCSVRCKNIDLNRWLSGAYVLPGAEEEAGDADDVETGVPRRDAPGGDG